MKDLEKIKSEDLAAQVQDANPANFAIEQEVAQLVGATVPQPTEPSADDALELGAQLLVFLRRALTPIQSALRTAVAAIYAHLDSRCTAYTPAAYDPFRLPAGPYDPMRPFVPRTLPNLLTALTAFSPRKISNGSAPNDGIPDGTSLANILCGAYADVLEITDDNAGWDASRYNWLGTLLGLFPNATKMTIGCGSMSAAMLSASYSNTCEIHIKSKTLYNQPNVACSIGGCEVWFDELETCNITDNGQPLCRAKKVYCPEFKKGSYRVAGHAGWSNGETVYMYVGCKGAKTDSIRFFGYYNTGYQVNTSPNLTDFEIRQGACQNLSVFGLVALTAENMYNHILCRLKQDVAGCGDGVTITLGTTNLEKLEAVELYNDKLTELEDTYGYTFA